LFEKIIKIIVYVKEGETCMSKVSFYKLWENHPYPDSPCDEETFRNQCAIRMGVALEKSGVDTSSFDVMYPNRRCYPGFNHSPKHILAAQELANWMKSKKSIFGNVSIYKNVTNTKFKGQKGVVFIKNGWESTDHIDVWNGISLKGGFASYFGLGKEVWFWDFKV
jgi:hypothetical protein